MAETSTAATAKGEATRRSILNAAIDRFGRDGFRATSVTDIARDARIGGSLVYNYFDSKAALFEAALDHDAAAVIDEAVAGVLASDDPLAWRSELMTDLVTSIERHPLARRVLAGLEPEVTERVVDVPSLVGLRAAVAERLLAGQRDGLVRPDIDTGVVGDGIVAMVIAMLMATVQLGNHVTLRFRPGVFALLGAAIDPVGQMEANDV